MEEHQGCSGDHFRIFGRMLLVALSEKLPLALILEVQDKPLQVFPLPSDRLLFQPPHGCDDT